MNFIAEVDVMPLKELLDPQGKAVLAGFKNLHIDSFTNVRIGKHITLTLESENETSAREQVEAACNKLLANPVIEFFKYDIKAVETA